MDNHLGGFFRGNPGVVDDQVAPLVLFPRAQEAYEEVSLVRRLVDEQEGALGRRCLYIWRLVGMSTIVW